MLTSQLWFRRACVGLAVGLCIDLCANAASLVEVRPGEFYGITLSELGVPDASTNGGCKWHVRNATLFRYTKQSFTALGTLPYSIHENGSVAHSAGAKLIDGTDGKLYGVVANDAKGGVSELFVYEYPPLE
jgi:hypothetical protein